MRVLCSADHHADERGRWSEFLKVHDFMVDVVRRERVDLVVSAGDIYEGPSTPRERAAVADWIERTAESCPVVIAKGNHDRPLDCEILGRLRTIHPVTVEERAGVHFVAGAAVAVMAWPDRAALAARFPDARDRDEAAREAFRAVLLGMRDRMADHAGPKIGLGHWMVDGSIVSTGQPLLGMPLNVGLADLALLEAPLVVCGHIHKAQEWTHGGTRILYPGSPYRTDFGQLEPKGIVLAEFDGPRLVDVRTIETPAAPMVHVQAEWSEYLGQDEDRPPMLYRDLRNIDDVSGAEIRVRYNVEADKRDAARLGAERYRAELLERGAASVKLEEVVIPVTRARAPEVARATTLADKLAALRASRGEVLEPERVSRLNEKTATLEVERHAAA